MRSWYCQLVHLSRSHSTAWHVWLQRVEQIAWLLKLVCFVAQGGDLNECGFSWDANADYERDQWCAADVWIHCRRLEQACSGLSVNCWVIFQWHHITVHYNIQNEFNYTGRHGISNITRYRAADVAQTPHVEVACFCDVVDILLIHWKNVNIKCLLEAIWSSKSLWITQQLMKKTAITKMF